MCAENPFDVLLWDLMEDDMSIVPTFLNISWGILKYRNLRLIENSAYTIQEVVDNCLEYIKGFY